MATLTKGKTFTNGELVTPQKLHELVDLASITGIVTAEITDSAITTAKLAANSVTTAKIADANVTTAKIADANVTTAKIADSAVTSAKIADGTIVNADINASAAIALSKLATGALPSGITVASANIVDDTIVNADINASAAIADTKLATISTAGKVSNSATTATNANTSSAIVARDASGNFSAGTITAALAGNAATATKLATARTITLGGDLSGSASFDGSANASITATVADDSHNHVIANIDGLQTALDGKQAAGSYAASSHTHTIANVTGLQTALDGKQASGSYAPATGIAPSAITGTAVITTDSRLSDARTPTSHTHDDRYYTETEVNNLLENKLNKSGPAEILASSPTEPVYLDLYHNASDDYSFRLISWPTINQITSGDYTRDQSKPFEIFAGPQPVIIQQGSGVTGIGTSTPNQKLSITTGDDARVNLYSTGNVGVVDAIANSDFAQNRWLQINPSGGWVAIGTGAPSYNLHVHGSVAGIGAYNNVSDAREKENIKYDFPYGLDIVNQLKPAQFDYKDTNLKNNYGFIAQDIKNILPEIITYYSKKTENTEEERFAIKETNLIAVLVKAVQELAARVATLEAAQ